MIYLECNPDKVLVNALGISNKEIKHAYSKGNVCNTLVKNNNVAGLVDEDPSSPQPGYIKTLQRQTFQHDIKVFADPRRGNRLIMLCPRLEEWIISAAHEIKVDLNDYDLSGNAKQLHKIINLQQSSLKKFVDAVKTRSAKLQTLASFLKS